MQTLKIDDATARKAYPSAIPEMKAILEQSFPEGFFSQEITDRVQTFLDVLKIAGKQISEYLLRPGETQDELAYRKIKLIAEVYNEGTVLDASDTSQYKYYPWHKVEKKSTHSSGLGLSYYRYVGWVTDSSVGVRLCFKNDKLAIDAGQKFIDIYEQLKIR